MKNSYYYYEYTKVQCKEINKLKTVSDGMKRACELGISGDITEESLEEIVCGYLQSIRDYCDSISYEAQKKLDAMPPKARMDTIQE